MATQLNTLFSDLACTVLKEQRAKLGLSQEALSARSGLARSYVCDVERGARHPSIRNLSILANALELSTSKIIAETELKLASLLDPAAPHDDLQQEILHYYSHRVNAGIVIANASGAFVLFNPAAENIIGLGLQEELAVDEWSNVYGCFYPDRVTLYPSRALPLARALEGDETDDVEIFLRNEKTDGTPIRATARTIRNDKRDVTGAIVIFSPLAV